MERGLVLLCDAHLSCASFSKMLALSEVQVPQEKIPGGDTSAKDAHLHPQDFSCRLVS